MKLIALGMLMIFLGVFVVMLGVFKSIQMKEPADQKPDVKAGGVILIGPIPIVFGTDRTMVLISIAGALLLLGAYYVWRSR